MNKHWLIFGPVIVGAFFGMLYLYGHMPPEWQAINCEFGYGLSDAIACENYKSAVQRQWLYIAAVGVVALITLIGGIVIDRIENQRGLKADL